MIEFEELYQEGVKSAQTRERKLKKRLARRLFKKAVRRLRKELKKGKSSISVWAIDPRSAWVELGLEKTEKVAYTVGRLLAIKHPGISYKIEQARWHYLDFADDIVEVTAVLMTITYEP